jgi:chromatin segregation and condensation protein Rec8/ScpA/Scc1 (kleisin family)
VRREPDRWVVSRLESLPFPAAVSAVDWFASQPSGQARAALFLALLELARKGVLLLYQEEDFAPIRVKALREATGNQHPEVAPFQKGQ